MFRLNDFEWFVSFIVNYAMKHTLFRAKMFGFNHLRLTRLRKTYDTHVILLTIDVFHEMIIVRTLS